MRIGIDVRPLMQQHYSGVAYYTYSLLDELFKLPSDDSYHLFFNARKNLEQHLPAFPYPHVTYAKHTYPNKLLNLSFMLTGRPQIDTLLGDVDIMFCPNSNFGGYSQKTKRVMTVHDLSYLRHPEFFDTKHQLWHTLSRSSRLLQTADHLIAVSEHTKRDCMELLGIPEEKITVVYEAATLTPPTKQEVEHIKKKYNLPNTFVLFLGTLEPRKNIPSLIKALEQSSSQPTLVLAGSFGWKYKEIQEAIRNTSAKIIHLNYVPHEEKAALMGAATVFAWPSWYEGFGLPLLESQLCKTPVITSAVTSLTEVAGSSALLVQPDHIHEISTAIDLLLHDPVLYAHYQEQGKLNAQRFSWQQAAEQMHAVFTSLIHQRI